MQKTERNKRAFELIKQFGESERQRQSMYDRNVARAGDSEEVAAQELADQLEFLLMGAELDPLNPPPECPTCHRNLKAEWKSLTKGLCNLLIKFRNRVHELGANDVRINEKFWPELTHNEYCNISVLRVFGLVHWVKDEENKPIKGRWLLTRNGGAFFRKELKVPKKRLMFLGKKEQDSVLQVGIDDILRDSEVPEWTSRDDVLFNRVPASPEQISLLNQM